MIRFQLTGITGYPDMSAISSIVSKMNPYLVTAMRVNNYQGRMWRWPYSLCRDQLWEHAVWNTLLRRGDNGSASEMAPSSIFCHRPLESNEVKVISLTNHRE